MHLPYDSSILKCFHTLKTYKENDCSAYYKKKIGDKPKCPLLGKRVTYIYTVDII